MRASAPEVTKATFSAASLGAGVARKKLETPRVSAAGLFYACSTHAPYSSSSMGEIGSPTMLYWISFGGLGLAGFAGGVTAAGLGAGADAVGDTGLTAAVAGGGAGGIGFGAATGGG